MKLFTLRMHFKFNHNLIDLHMYMNSDKVEKRRKENKITIEEVWAGIQK